MPRGLPLSTYAPRGGWVGSSLLYIFIAYYMQKGGGWVQIACKVAYVLNGRSPTDLPTIMASTVDLDTVTSFAHHLQEIVKEI